ncbi:MAG: hypothetical protein ABWK01_01270 [Infirmifilum sp.]
MGELFDAYESALRDKKRRGFIAISGAGKAGGGYYEAVKISGAGRIEGDVDALKVNVAGSASFHGSLAAREAKFAGATKVYGFLKSGRVQSAGTLKVEGCIEADEIELAGALSAGCLKFKKANIQGALKIVGGITGSNLTLKLSDDSRVGDILVDILEVRRGKDYDVVRRVKALFNKGLPVLEASKIEAGEAIFKDVIVKSPVRARRIILRGKAEVVGEAHGEVLKEK